MNLHALALETNRQTSDNVNFHQTLEALRKAFDIIGDELYAGKKIRIDRLGTFDTSIRKPTKTMSRLPHTFEKVYDVPAKIYPTFKYSRVIKSKLATKKVFWQDDSEPNKNY